MKYIILAFCLFLACAGPKKNEVEQPKEPTPGAYMYIQVKNYGEIVIKFYENEAPNNVASIIKLAKKGFYDGLTFHRIIAGFVIQGGCPIGDGTGDPGYRLDDEISANLKHQKGTVALANSGPNTNGSQFYICLSPLPRLDGRYTIIGKVVEGMVIVDKIGSVKTTGPPMDRPLSPIIMEKIWIEER